MGRRRDGAIRARTGGLNRKSFVECILSTASASAMIFLILLGAQLFNSFLAITQMPHALAEWIGTSGFSPMTILLVMLLTYLIFGCVMDSQHDPFDNPHLSHH